MIQNSTAKGMFHFQDTVVNSVSGATPSASFAVAYAAGKFGKKLVMDGTTYLEYSTPLIGVNYTGPFIIGCWLDSSFTQPNPYGVIYSEGNPGQTANQLSLFMFRKVYNTNVCELYMRNNAANLVMAGSFPFTLTTTPQHVMVGRVGNNFVAFVEGQAVTVTMTSSQAAVMNTNTYAIIGGYHSNSSSVGFKYKGNLDELYIDRIEGNAADAKRLMCGLHPLERV